jgi:hemoglobin
VPARAWLTGQLAFASSAAATKSSSLIPSTVPRTVSRISVMPVPGTKSTSAEVFSSVGGVPALARPLEKAIEKHAEWAAAMSSSGLVLPFASSARDAHVTSYVPMPEDCSSTLPAPSNSEPCQVVSALRVVAMLPSLAGRQNGSVSTFYDEIGGYETIRLIVARFYAGVAEDEVLRPLYPEEDLGPAEERFRDFLVQYWGGPTTYSDGRGHPRLRMRHAPFAVTPTAKDHWLTHFRAGLDEAVQAGLVTPEQDTQFWEYVTHAAQFMVNHFDEAPR